jgi:acyl-coenzyme A thioesterase PaaI-like protein
MTAGQVRVTATPVQQGRVQQLWDVRIVDTADRLVARGSVRLQNVPLPSPATGPNTAEK